MSLVTLTVGIPASGKSTWAREQARENGSVIVCRDDIRIAHGLKHGENEDLITRVHRAQIEAAVLENLDVIVADTNINKKFRNQLIRMCHQLGADVEIKTFPINVNVAITRDMNREAKVGAAVISRMHEDMKNQNIADDLLPVQTYAPYERPSDFDSSKRPAYVFDIDGTVAKMVDRSPFDYMSAGSDEPVVDVLETAYALSQAGYWIIFASGREESSRQVVHDWMDNYSSLEDYSLVMRKTGDMRPDWIVKNELYDQWIIPYYDIVGVFDDRDQVVRHLRRRGITVFQVNYGRF